MNTEWETVTGGGMADADDARQENPKILLKVYELYMARYNAIFPRVPQDLRLYSTINVAVLGGLVALLHEKLFIQADPHLIVYQFIAILGGSVIVVIARLGERGSKSSYDAWTRTISTLAKLEKLLGLHDSQERWEQSGRSAAIWRNEPIVIPRHTIDVRKDACSERFVTRLWAEEDYARIIRYTFCAWQVAGVMVILVGTIPWILKLYSMLIATKALAA